MEFLRPMAANIAMNVHEVAAMGMRNLGPCNMFLVICAFYFVIYWSVRNELETEGVCAPSRLSHTSKNIMKAYILHTLFPITASIIYMHRGVDLIPTPTRILLGHMYGATDAIGLLVLNKRLSWATLFHHIVVMIVTYTNATTDMTGIWRGFIIYTAFCTMTGIVNTCIAVDRFDYRRWRCVLALVMYVGASIPNWAMQLWLVMHGLLGLPNPVLTWSSIRVNEAIANAVASMSSPPSLLATLAYALMLCAIVYDDCNLMQWLWQNSFRRRAHKLQKVN